MIIQYNIQCDKENGHANDRHHHHPHPHTRAQQLMMEMVLVRARTGSCAHEGGAAPHVPRPATVPRPWKRQSPNKDSNAP